MVSLVLRLLTSETIKSALIVLIVETVVSFVSGFVVSMFVVIVLLLNGYTVKTDLTSCYSSRVTVPFSFTL